ncbi:MAG TPA: MBL fold metallo-hydrolase [Micromonosporaceae bacterium]|jgi:L-ascorbate metabolism protein UlaG (beta-lactamase superfamily)
MLLTRFSHACVRLESDGRVLVIDPGTFAESVALDGADAVLVTHEHGDHVDVTKLTGRDLPVFAPAPVVEQLAAEGVAATAVAANDAFDAAGFAVRAVGGAHADIFAGYPGCANVGFVVDDNVYHPGDSYFVPDLEISTLLVPAAGPWAKLSESIEFTRAIRPVRAIPIHDAILNDAGRELADSVLGHFVETDYQRVAVGSSIEI